MEQALLDQIQLVFYGSVVVLLLVLTIMAGRIIGLLSALLEKGQQTDPAFSRLEGSGELQDCTEEELAALSAVMAKMVPRKDVAIRLRRIK